MVRRKCRRLEERLKLYDEVMKLRRLGLDCKQIAKSIKENYGISMRLNTIRDWIKSRYHPLGRCNKIVEGPGLAYVMSAWLGDGSLARWIKNSQHDVRLQVSDYNFAEEWGRRLAEALGRSKPYVPRWSNSSKMWFVKASSVLLYSLLKRAREDPWILMPYLQKYPTEACKGFFDAEGSVNVYKNAIEASNTDPRVVQMFKMLLEKIGIWCTMHETPYKSDTFISPCNGKRYRRNKLIRYRLAIYGKENILRFAEEVGFTITRKRTKLCRILEKYNRMKIQRRFLEKHVRTLIAANLRKLGLMTGKEAAKLLLISQSSITQYLQSKTKISKLLGLPEIEQLSREYFYSQSSDIIIKVREILQTIVEIYGG